MFLPTTQAELRQKGWDALDIILIMCPLLRQILGATEPNSTKTFYLKPVVLETPIIINTTGRVRYFNQFYFVFCIYIWKFEILKFYCIRPSQMLLFAHGLMGEFQKVRAL